MMAYTFLIFTTEYITFNLEVSTGTYRPKFTVHTVPAASVTREDYKSPREVTEQWLDNHNSNLAPWQCSLGLTSNLTLILSERSSRKQAASVLCVCVSMLVWLKSDRQKLWVSILMLCVFPWQTNLLLRLCCVWACKVRLKLNASIQPSQRLTSEWGGVTFPDDHTREKEMKTLLRFWHVKCWRRTSRYVQVILLLI